MRSPSEERADARIVSLEAQLAELEVANKFEECVVLTERIEQMKKAQTDISRLKAKREEARATRDFKACAEIQKQIDELKVCWCAFHEPPFAFFFLRCTRLSIPSSVGPGDSCTKSSHHGHGHGGNTGTS